MFVRVVVDYTTTRYFRTLQVNIFAKKNKFVKPFQPVYKWPRWSVLYKNKGLKSNVISL